jgi:hypothetical protein
VSHPHSTAAVGRNAAAPVGGNATCVRGEIECGARGDEFTGESTSFATDDERRALTRSQAAYMRGPDYWGQTCSARKS